MREFITYMESLRDTSTEESNKKLLDNLIIKCEELYSKMLWNNVPETIVKNNCVPYKQRVIPKWFIDMEF